MNYTRGVKGCLIRKTNTLKIIVVFINSTQNLCSKRARRGPSSGNKDCTICTLYVYNFSRLCKILSTVFWGTRSSFEAQRVDLQGLRWKASRTASTISSLTLGLPLLLQSPTLPVSTDFQYHDLMLLTSGGGRPYSFLNFRCTVTGDFVSWCHRTHWAFSFIDAILTLAGYAAVTTINTSHKTLEINLSNGKNICLYST